MEHGERIDECGREDHKNMRWGEGIMKVDGGRGWAQMGNMRVV
jgi:hypothetical protein